MNLIILGSGTCVPSLKRSGPANYLKIADKQILVDIGPGTLRRMLEAEINYQDIDYIFISHFHADHVTDLRSFIQATNWTPGFIRKKELTIIGPIGLREYYQRAVRSKPQPNTYEMKLVEIEDSLSTGGFEVRAQKTIHDEDGATIYRFIEGDKSVVITSDCEFDNSLISFSEGTDILIAECSFANEERAPGHLIPRECGQIALEAKVGKLVLNHLYPTVPDEVKLEQTKEVFVDTILAEDLMEIEL